MAYTTAHLRRAYFALVKGLAMTEEDRHAFNLSRVGKESTKTWGRKDWKAAVAELQQLNGQTVSPGRPRLKADKPTEVSVEDGEFATARQCEMIEDLCDQIAWYAGRELGPLAYVLQHFLADPKYTLIKRHLAAEKWTALPRDVASALIVGLRNMAKHYPVERQSVVPCSAKPATQGGEERSEQSRTEVKG